MDSVVTTVIGAAPQLGVAGVLLSVLVLLMRRETQDRADQRTALADLTARHAAELVRVNADHDAELAELRKEIARLRRQLDETDRKLDLERALRRAAQDNERPVEDIRTMGQHRRREPPSPR